jgi:hypothetical protein
VLTVTGKRAAASVLPEQTSNGAARSEQLPGQAKEVSGIAKRQRQDADSRGSLLGKEGMATRSCLHTSHDAENSLGHGHLNVPQDNEVRTLWLHAHRTINFPILEEPYCESGLSSEVAS